MKKFYYHNGEIISFNDVRMEAGMLYGRCITQSNHNKWAWLDPRGFQFEQEHRIEALEVFHYEYPLAIPRCCHYWGGEIRNNILWRNQW